MNRLLTAILVLAALVVSLRAQTAQPTPGTNTPAVAPQPPKEILPPEPAPETNSGEILKPTVTIVAPTETRSLEKPDRPALPSDVAPTADVKNLVERFQQAREDFIAQQRAISTAPRDTLTEQQRLLWMERRMALREEFKVRLAEIRNEFRSRELREVLDAARNSVERSKPRVGED